MALPENGILHIKVYKAATRGIPFDQFYLVPKTERELFKRVFPAYVRTQFNDTLWSRILGVEVSSVAKTDTTGYHRKETLDPLATLSALWQTEQWPEVHSHFDVAVPVVLQHPKTVPDERNNPMNGSARLGYLVARGWHRSRAASQSPKLVNRLDAANTVFVAYGEEVRPLCLACPRLHDVLDGRCSLGDDYCLRTIGLVGKPTYLARLKVYKESEDLAEVASAFPE